MKIKNKKIVACIVVFLALFFWKGQMQVTLAETNQNNNADFVITDKGKTLEGYKGNMEEVIIPEGIVVISEFAFKNNSNVKKVVLPNSVTTIGKDAFYGCTNMENINIPNSVISLGDSAFSKCTSLKSITLPQSIQFVGDDVFGNCTSLETITVSKGVPLNNVTMLEGTEWLNIEREKGLVIINDILLDGTNCEGKVVIPSKVKQIGEGAFYQARYITSVTIPDSVTSIGSYAFKECSRLTKVIMGKGVKSIGHFTFFGCRKLETITVPDTIESIGQSAFEKTIWIENQRKKNPLVIIGTILIDGKTAEKKVVIPSKVKVINELAFEYNEKITSIDLGEVETVGFAAFLECTNLSSVVFSKKLTSLPEHMFDGCASLNKVTVPNHIKSISTAFIKSGIVSITLPKNLSKIDDGAFFECEKLVSIKIPNTVKEIGEKAFVRCWSLKQIVIPDSVKKLGISAFQGCISLEKVTLSKNLSELMDGTFENCSKLTTIELPSRITTLGNRTFYYCDLKKIVLDKNIKSVGGKCFDENQNLVLTVKGNKNLYNELKEEVEGIKKLVYVAK